MGPMKRRLKELILLIDVKDNALLGIFCCITKWAMVMSACISLDPHHIHIYHQGGR
jgi:hypothetical protein